MLTFLGLFIPAFFSQALGSALATIRHSPYVDPYEDGQVGKLLDQVLTPWHAFGKVILVLLALSPV